MSKINPLLRDDELPAFSEIKPEHIKEAISSLISECRNVIDSVTSIHKDDPTIENVLDPIEESSEKLSKAWGIISHLNSVLSTEDFRKAHDEMLPEISDYFTWVGQHEGLYNAYKKIIASDSWQSFSKEKQRSLKFALQDFELSGIGLSTEDRKKFSDLENRLSTLSSEFSNHVLDATNKWFKHVTDLEALKGLPETALNLAKQEAKNRGLDGYVITLRLPSYLPVMQYAENRELRRECYEAYVTRASSLGPNAGEFNNDDVISEELKLTNEQAKLLGFKNYAERSLARKMAESPEMVMNFLNDLVKKSYAQGVKEVSELKDFAKNVCNVSEELQPWDMSFFSEKLKENKYAVNDEMVRPYFPLPKVLEGLFKLVNVIFGLKVTEHKGVDVWHPDVSFYDIFDRNGTHRGSFYMDLYARENKNGGAWMDSCIDRKLRKDGSLQIPVAYVICNFTPPVGGRPSLLNHYEVETLFHEFGHSLHHMLTLVNEPDLAGINNVPWDAVETPSQFMENFTWEPEVLAMISGHVDTGEKLPNDLLDKLLKAKNFESAMGMLRQLEFSLFDFRAFMEYGNGVSAHELIEQVRKDVCVVPVVPFNRFENSFTHIFAGGYSAGYYSYKWAEVLSSDIYFRFEEEGVLNPEVGKSFMESILEKGGSEDFMDLFVKFRGRKPTTDALLRHSGISSK